MRARPAIRRTTYCSAEAVSKTVGLLYVHDRYGVTLLDAASSSWQNKTTHSLVPIQGNN